MPSELKPEVKERPILFSGPMVRAILEGRKTQTRRIVKAKDSDPSRCITLPMLMKNIIEWREQDGRWFGIDGYDTLVFADCPYGAVGDQIWVRETYFQIGHWEPVLDIKTKRGRMKWRFVADSEDIRFDEPESYRKGRHHKDPATSTWHKRLGRFMPRKASRITLEITGVRVERLNDITEADAVAEGFLASTQDSWRKPGTQVTQVTAVENFEKLWHKINGTGSWAANPWVWVIEFQRKVI